MAALLQRWLKDPLVAKQSLGSGLVHHDHWHQDTTSPYYSLAATGSQAPYYDAANSVGRQAYYEDASSSPAIRGQAYYDEASNTHGQSRYDQASNTGPQTRYDQASSTPQQNTTPQSGIKVCLASHFKGHSLAISARACVCARACLMGDVGWEYLFSTSAAQYADNCSVFCVRGAA